MMIAGGSLDDNPYRTHDRLRQAPLVAIEDIAAIAAFLALPVVAPEIPAPESHHARNQSAHAEGPPLPRRHSLAR
jgi:hypothetical protein